MLKEVLGIVEDEQISLARQPARNLTGVMRAADLFVSSRGDGPVGEYGRRVALVVARCVAEPIQEISVCAGGECDAASRIVAQECAPVINDVELAADRVDDDLVKCLIVINRVAMEPVALHWQARDVRV